MVISGITRWKPNTARRNPCKWKFAAGNIIELNLFFFVAMFEYWRVAPNLHDTTLWKFNIANENGNVNWVNDLPMGNFPWQIVK
jgi:hypothetical protein